MCKASKERDRMYKSRREYETFEEQNKMRITTTIHLLLRRMFDQEFYFKKCIYAAVSKIKLLL